MKTKILSFTLILGAALLSAITATANTSDSTKVEKKIIKVVTVDDEGTIVIDSTFTTKDGKVSVKVDSTFHAGMPGHRTGGMRHERTNRMMQWSDDSGKTFNMEIESDGDSTQVMVIGESNVDPFEMTSDLDGFPCHKKIMMLNDSDDFPMPPAPPVPPCHFKGKQGVIDLNDPSIISFEKKTQKDGTEKITIVRKIQ